MPRRATRDLLPGTLDLLILRTLQTEAHEWDRMSAAMGWVMKFA
jgi:hypothetical protein